MVYQFTGKRTPTAIQWYNDEVPYFEEIDKEDVEGGDIYSDGSHVGIVSKYDSTISANDKMVIENDQDFRNDNADVKFFALYKTP